MTDDRRRARKAALQALFEANQAGHDPEQALASRAGSGGHLSAGGLEFARALVRGVVNNKEHIDAIIVRTAPAWPVDQLAVIDRVALEMGIYEVCIEKNTPLEVAINEAVELAKVFGGENSAGFVNGVLRTVAEQLPAAQFA